MGRVLTNNTSFAAAVETTLGTAPAAGTWFLLEPNDISSYGAEITTVARNPISKNRQRQKGTVTDLDSAAEFEHDLTMSVFELFAEAWTFSTAVNADMIFRGANATGSGTGFTIPSATAAQAAKFQYTSGGPISLVYARGYANSANNGIHPLSADVAATDTAIPVASLTTETAPANAEVEMCGMRAEAGDLALAVSSGVGTLSSGNNSATNNIDFTTLGLTVGQMIHVGGLTTTNRFGSTAAGDGTDSYGYARVTAIAAGSLTLDKLDSTLVASDGTDDGNAGTLTVTDLLFGRFIRNVAVDDSSFLTRSFTMEAAFDNLGSGGAAEYSYSKGNLCNEITFNLPLADKATVSFGFVGTDTDNPTTTRLTNADTPVEPVKTGAFNTSADIMRLRITQVDETGLTTDFKDVSLTFRNNVTPEKVLGTLGAAYMNTGNFEVDLESEILFTDGDVIDAIRANTEVTADFIIKNSDGAIAVDIPAMTLGGGAMNFPVNESVTLSTTGQAHQDTTLSTSVGISIFPVVPTS